jgi:hypothetical protein
MPNVSQIYRTPMLVCVVIYFYPLSVICYLGSDYKSELLYDEFVAYRCQLSGYVRSTMAYDNSIAG